MRPIRLEMTAFGSYAEKTTVPFAELKNGLYLITGDTGAGKTTIFDAIVFALYGVASGTEKEDRQPEMMHSDFVPKSVDTEVELEFFEGGKTYVVSRSIHFQKKRGAEEAYGDPKINATLTEPDRNPTEGARNVTRRVQELLGMNPDQFRKIVMLAQGEFSKFLKADSDEKNKILSELFDNRLCEYYAELLAAVKKKLADRRDEKRRTLENTLKNSFLVPEDFTEEQKIQFHPEHPALCENMEALIADENEAVRRLGAEAEAAQAEFDALNRRQGAAEALNRQFDELGEKRERLISLDRQEPEMQARRAVRERAEAALHEALPYVRELHRAQKALSDNGYTILANEKELVRLDKTREAAEAARDGDEENKKRAEALRNAVRKINGQLPIYEELEKELAKQKAAQNMAALAGAEAEKAAKTEADILKRAAERKKELAALEGIDGVVSDRRNAVKRAEERLRQLTGRDGLIAKTEEIRRLEADLAAAESSFLEAVRAAGEKMDAYHDLYQHFIAGQAGILAGELRAEIERDGSARCPVCGALRSAEHFKEFAFAEGEFAGREAVDAARAEQEAAERTRADADKTVGSLKTGLMEKKRGALETAAVLFEEEVSWEALSSNDFPAAKKKEFAAAAREAEAACNEAVSAGARRNRLKKEADEAEKALENVQKAIRDAEGRKSSGTVEAAAAGARAEGLRGQLQFKERSEAERESRRAAAEEKRLSEEILRHERNYEAAEKACSDARGRLAVLRQQKTGLEENLKKAAETMRERLTGLHFADEEAVLAALPPTAERQQESWLRKEREAIASYDNDRLNTRARVLELEEALAGREYTDLAALAVKIAEADAASREKAGQMHKMGSLLENHIKTLKLVKEQRAYLDETAEAWERAVRLGSLAEGTKSEGGRISFDRYVIGAVFREILTMANRRLDIMSGGKYRLVYKSGARRVNSAAGLETSVLDLTTGQERDSNSLSGGESFFTSLALALGLSDVVQNHAGGRRLDAIFIDEGFGTLSDDVLDLALTVLGSLTEGNRMVGLISHVDKLNESIPQKINVRNGKKGSSLTVETA